ncbi:MAG TPA: peptide-methionine (S)-S-oxide reductase MsrA [Candidatus Nanoarchaeia archaeon]|nr:peptide-methionine (S)-S-oxide reductase MsrA [Candidatus Nanoarchaeia archaeon]
MNLSTEKAIFAAGCFWGVQEEFDKLPGVISTRVGYTGGRMHNPTYEDVCSDTTEHAEAVEIIFNPKEISYSQLLDAFWGMHDATQLNKQGNDFGKQYRSAIFYTNSKQRELAIESKELEQQMTKEKIVTQIVKATEFYEAESLHQKYYQKKGKGFSV